MSIDEKYKLVESMRASGQLQNKSTLSDWLNIMFHFHDEQEQKMQEILNFLKHKYEIKQDSDLLKEIRKIDRLHNSKLHLSFMFSSPLIIETFTKEGTIKIQELQKIDYQKEFYEVQQGLKTTKKHIKYRKICATYENFIKCINEKTLALHFSGHGLKNSENYG